MDIPILQDCFYKVWLSNAKQLLLCGNWLGKQGNVISQPQNQALTYRRVRDVQQQGTRQLGAGIPSQYPSRVSPRVSTSIGSCKRRHAVKFRTVFNTSDVVNIPSLTVLGELSKAAYC